MIDALKFVQRGISRSEGANFFAIRDQRVTVFNGTLALSAPLNLSFNTAPLGVPFMRAIEACEDTISITQESKSKLVVRSGRFKATVPCVEVSTIPQVKPEGLTFTPQGLVAAFTVLKSFVCSDPQKPSVRSILLTGQSAYATNNIAIVQYWTSTAFPLANVPVEFIEEVVRLKEEPSKIQISEGSISFHYSDGRWIRSQLIQMLWPNVARILSEAWVDEMEEIKPELKKACLKLGKYVGKASGKTYFRGTDVATAKDDLEDGIACVTVNAPTSGCYCTKYLNDVLEVANKAAFDQYPKAVAFQGERVRGILLGVRK